ncbi:MAG: hypothetical protein H6702_21280, partial [Myxococcales bacterium]|nr:hypothetical protein [Myxococcales bacterium]
ATLGPEGAGKLVGGLNRLEVRVQLRVLQTRENLVESIAYLKETSENMTAFSAKIREDPSLLLLGEGGDE